MVNALGICTMPAEHKICVSANGYMVKADSELVVMKKGVERMQN